MFYNAIFVSVYVHDVHILLLISAAVNGKTFE